MKKYAVKLIDASHNVLAIAHVVDFGDWYGGTIDLGFTPSPLRALFDEFEEIVNGQMLSFLDKIQEQIASLAVKAVFEMGCEVFVNDLQVFPSTAAVSFKLLGSCTQHAANFKGECFMSPTLKSLGIDRLSVAERILLVEEIWDSIAEESEQVPITEAQKQDLQLRLTAYEANPRAGSSWEEVKARLREQS